MSTTNLAASQSSKTMPIRAITSTLSVRSAPSIPPASQTYEPLVKSILRHRQTRRIFLYSAAFSWVQAVIWVTWTLGGLSELGMKGIAFVPFMPFTLLVTLSGWLVGALPVVVLRKLYLTAYRKSSSTPEKIVRQAFSDQRTMRALVAYSTSAILTIGVHAFVCYATESIRGDPRLTVFVKSRKHPYYLNGRLVFLCISQITMALLFLLRNVTQDRFVFRWPSASMPRNSRWPLGFAEIAAASLIVAICASLALISSVVVFATSRMALPPLYKLPLLHVFLRPFTAHFLRGSWTLLLPFRHFTLIIRAWFLSFSTMASWEISELLFDFFIPQPVSVSRLTADPSLTLLSGISSADGTFKYFAYSELNELATDASQAASARRTALFGDQKYSPSMWSHLCRESLLLLGHDYQTLLRRGKPAPPLAAAASPPARSSAPSTPAPTPLIKSQVYKSSKQSPIRTIIDSFASDGTVPKALEAGADAANIPEIFRSVEAAVLPPPARAEVKKSVASVRGVGEKLQSLAWTYVPKPVVDLLNEWGAWWTTERISMVVNGSLPSREMDALVIEVLSHLTCASLTEDRYGVVQRDIPKILEAMLSFLAAIEAYQVELTALRAESASERELDKAADMLSVVGDGLKDSVSRIVHTFGDKLLAYKFPPRTAQKLQGFLDYIA